MKKVLIINGPNLNLLGIREPDIYSSKTFDEIYLELEEYARKNDIELSYFQSNSEGEIINKMHGSIGSIDFFILNPGALTHYSYSLYDSMLATKIPTIEVHLTNIFTREKWRQKSVISAAALGVISGFGGLGYRLALEYIAEIAVLKHDKA